ncbi:hypothetical protein Tco_1357471 [Tanacetum coccineum]
MNSIWKFWFNFGFGPLCGHLEFVRDYEFGYDLGHHSRIYVRGVTLLLAFACSRFGALVMSVIEMYNAAKDERVGRVGRGRGPRGGNNERVDELNGQGNDQGLGANKNVGNQGNVGNQNGNVVNENVQENIRNVLVNGNQVGCSYKEFLACNPKEYDGKGVKYIVGSFVGKALTWWNSQIRTLSQEVANHAMVGAGHAAYTDRFHELIFGALADEAVRNGSIKKVKKRGNVGEPSRNKNGRDDNKRTRTGNAFATTANLIGRKNTGD